jgi:hypothetical protein
VRYTNAHAPEKRMERAETIAALAQRASWTKKHWTPFFSEMPLRMLSSGSLRCPSAVIARTAENSATFSALEVSTLKKMLDYENIQEMMGENENSAVSAVVDKR